MTAGQAWSVFLRSTPKAASLVWATSHGTTARTICESEDTSTMQRKISSPRLAAFAANLEHSQSPALLVAIAGKPFGKEDFTNLWHKRNIDNQHPEFGTTIQLESHVQEKAFPSVYNLDLQERIQELLRVSSNLQELLWQVETFPGGELGQSGAIPKDQAAAISMDAAEENNAAPKESLLLIRGHPQVADGISLTEAFINLCDEAAELKEKLQQETQLEIRKLKSQSWWQKLVRLLQSIFQLSVEPLQAFLRRWRLYLLTSENPFQQIESLVDEDAREKGQASVSWAQLAPKEEIAHVAESLKKRHQDVTVNDVIVSCVSAAVARQIQEHHMQYEMDGVKKKKNIKLPSTLTAMVVGREGRAVSQLFAQVPNDITSTAGQRLREVHKSISNAQEATIPTWSRLGARLISKLLPTFLTPPQPNAAFLITSTNAPQQHVHLDGRRVEVCQAFTPLPDGIPIGVVVSNYAGKLTISLAAAPWAVPDSEKFLSWVQTEYKYLYTESPVALE